jgi:hypothetical protein
MGTTTVITALAGVGVLIAAVLVGVLMVLGDRGRVEARSDRIRRFFADRRDGRGGL